MEAEVSANWFLENFNLGKFLDFMRSEVSRGGVEKFQKVSCISLKEIWSLLNLHQYPRPALTQQVISRFGYTRKEFDLLPTKLLQLLYISYIIRKCRGNLPKNSDLPPHVTYVKNLLPSKLVLTRLYQQTFKLGWFLAKPTPQDYKLVESVRDQYYRTGVLPTNEEVVKLIGCPIKLFRNLDVQKELNFLHPGVKQSQLNCYETILVLAGIRIPYLIPEKRNEFKPKKIGNSSIERKKPR